MHINVTQKFRMPHPFDHKILNGCKSVNFTSNTGLTKPVNLLRSVHEPVNFLGRKIEKDRYSKVYIIAFYPTDLCIIPSNAKPPLEISNNGHLILQGDY